jgi:AraC-like DNA-binding protein
MNTDYGYLAYSLSSLAGLPVRLYRNGVFCNLYHHTKFKPDLAILEEPNIFRNEGSVSYYMDENFLYYGLFRVKKDDVALLVGPVAQMPVNTASAGKILRAMGEPASRAKELVDYFSTMPAYPLRTFLQILCTIHYFINGEKTDISQLLLGQALPPLQLPSEKNLQDPAIHNTMELEEWMLSCVEHGRTEDIQAMFRSPTMGRAGAMATDVLRQQKNLIICTATLVTRAAIRGGLDRATAFALSDMYIQKAELMADVLDLTRLNAQMVLDFTKRVEAEKCGSGHSELVRKVRDHVLSHIETCVTTDTLAKLCGMNRTYLCKLFAEETGMTVSQYVTGIKMEEAKRLMDITPKTIAEIAAYLGYSSQSHFQRVFKKYAGITPGEYRKKQH